MCQHCRMSSMPEHDWTTFFVFCLNAANRFAYPTILLNKKDLKICWLAGMTAGQAVTEQIQRDTNVYPESYRAR